MDVRYRSVFHRGRILNEMIDFVSWIKGWPVNRADLFKQVQLYMYYSVTYEYEMEL